MRLTRQLFGIRTRRLLMHWCAGDGKGLRNGTQFDVAIVKLDRLGDFVLASGAIRRITEHFGERRCLLVVSPVAAKLAAQTFPQAALVVLPFCLSHIRAVFAAFRHRKELLNLRVNSVVCFRHQRWDYDELVLRWLGGRASYRILDDYTRRLEPDLRFYDYDGLGGFKPKECELVVSPSGVLLSRELEWHRQVLEHVLGRVVEDCEVLPSNGSAPGAEDCIVVSPFGSEEIRNIPSKLLISAIGTIYRKLVKQVILVGVSIHESALHEIARLLKPEIRGVEIQTHLTVNEYQSLIGRAACVVSADTATAHIAIAFDKPTLVFLGGGHYGQFGPWQRSPKQKWLSNRLDCEWCNWNCRYPEAKCITEISIVAVEKAIEQILPGI